MIVLGISGFEDLAVPSYRSAYSASSRTIEELLGFSPHGVPLQGFPLHLIGHDCAAALLVDGKLVAFVSEERLTRVKHGYNLAGRTVLPRLAIRYCLDQAGISFSDVDYVAHYCRFTEESVARRLDAVASGFPQSELQLLEREYRESYRNRLSREVLLRQLSQLAEFDIPEDRLKRVPHHLAHAAGSFYSSGFPEAAILTVDGYGEEESALWGTGDGGGISARGSVSLPASLGVLYQIVTAYLGFRSFGDEFKVMGLSSYGDPKKYRNVFEEMVILLPDGAFTIEGLARSDLLNRLREVFGVIDSPGNFSRKSADIAAALQLTLERALLHLLSGLRDEYQLPNLCLSGGVALNACANGAILRSGLFENVFIQPAAGDDGACLGAACFASCDLLRQDAPDPVRHVFWGPGYDAPEIEDVLRRAPVQWKKVPRVEKAAAALLADGKIVGWFQGRAEMGPRALGARSILADPRSTALRDKLNARIKRREPFRPFAPVVSLADAPGIFDMPPGLSSPYMLVTFATKKEKQDDIPGVVHVDGSARVQTVTKEDNGRYYELIKGFEELTGLPVLLNTSFNRAGEPIVNSPEDAVRCFIAGGLDALVLEDYLILPQGMEI